MHNKSSTLIRRAHLNDLENILPYILISFTYMLTDPLPDVAVNLFRVAVAARLWHTIIYAIYVVPQPARIIGFLIPLIITIYMAVMTAIVFVNWILLHKCVYFWRRFKIGETLSISNTVVTTLYISISPFLPFLGKNL